MSDAAALAEVLAASRKYRFVCPETVARVAGWALARARSPRAASDLARRKLHQVYGAYVRPADHTLVQKALDGLGVAPRPAELQAACRLALGLHSSTRERLRIMERCLPEVLAEAGSPRSVVDLACGFGAFGLPWMGLGSGALYTPLDIDMRTAELGNRLLQLLGRPPTARCLDLLGPEPYPQADVTLLLKVLPCLERQEPGAAAEVLGRVRSRAVVVSFPLQSLGGRERGMAAHYDGMMQRLAPSASMRRLEYTGEAFYIWTAG